MKAVLTVFRRKPEVETIEPRRWISVDPQRHLTATADTFEELRNEPGFGFIRDKVYEWDGGKWWLLEVSYSPQGAFAPYVGPTAHPRAAEVARGRYPQGAYEGTEGL